MNKDAPDIRANETGSGFTRDILRGKGCKYTLSLGVIAGIAIGVLNLSVTATESKFQGFFDAFNYPAIVLMSAANDRFGFLNGKSSDVCQLYLLVVLICYWVVIGLFLASLLCFARDRICRRALLFGAGGGVLAGCLNCTITVSQWDGPRRYIDILGRSINLPIDMDQIQVEIFFWLLVEVFYWTLIGLLLASIFCVIRILKQRKAVRGNPVSGE